MDFQKLKKGLIFSIFVGFFVFAGLSIYGDVGQLVEAFVIFDYDYLPFILMLAPLNYFFRYIKWSYYLKLIDVDIPRKENILIFLSGLAMTITPGKIGELLKAYLLKEKKGIPISSTAPLIIGERFTDGISVMILAGIGSVAYKHGITILLLILLIVVAFIWVVQRPKLVYKLLELLSNIKFLRSFDSSMKNFYDKTYMILQIKPLAFAVSIGVVSWFFEGVVIYLTTLALGFELHLLACIFVVSFSFIIGALSMMPGGLFAVEGSVVALLMMMGLTRDLSVATTIITRFSTLWLGVALGLVGLVAICKNRVDI
ncbi:lysylphosphatidylglycerol synthase transmembrane domain-containing protein [Crassaminicella indica]|uniref:Phosphatidylglycerol lysyltransferase n=1 Tax=Crassaminicella indica TaxID=2855394 RepID=A0ABX8RCI1_9CLOT|nr:lysylphosphatidylglycerol synthase transmembrane domain-containing protein [Crassaminicella indica]QXM06749.1 flippase-like domain-containing protein [Crassaminicella indica]